MLKYKVWVPSCFEDFGKKFSRAWVGLLLFTLVLGMFSVLGVHLSDRDSLRVAGIAREMAVSSDYLIPRLNGKMFLEYPPVGYWPIALSLFMSKKPSEFLAFLPILFLGTGTVLITYSIGKKLAGEKIGLRAGFILATMSSFINYHRNLTVDSMLLFLTTLSLYGFVAGYQASKIRFLFVALFCLAMAGALLSKGLIGAAIPAATVTVFLITQKEFKSIVKLLLNPALLFFILPVVLWVGCVWRLDGLGICDEILRQSLFRFLSPSADHAEPFYYYFTIILIAALPWTILPFVLIWHRWKPDRLKEPHPQGSLLRFALVWLLTGLIGLSFASAKRPVYLGPLYPSLALLAALGWERLREKLPRVKRWEAHGLIAMFFIYVGVCLMVITPMENKKSLRRLYKTVSSLRTNGPVYLVDPSEAIRGASFFYLGRRIPVLKDRDVLSGQFDGRPGTILLIDSKTAGNQLFPTLQSKGYHLLLLKKYTNSHGVYVYSNGP
jgi:4-amino-4-deoxy-L-arabinose transferase-like glycosyltransferase